LNLARTPQSNFKLRGAATANLLPKLGNSLAKIMQGSSSVLIGDVDCTVEKDLGSQHSASGYPTLKYWKDGEKTDYSRGRSFDDNKNFAEQNRRQSAT
jgi:hypothetical protein